MRMVHIYWIAWSIVMELFREKLGGMALLKEVCPWAWALRFQKYILGSDSLSLQ